MAADTILKKIENSLISQLDKRGSFYTSRGCDIAQSMSRVVNECSETILPGGGLQRLHSPDNGAVNWLKETTTKTVAK